MHRPRVRILCQLSHVSLNVIIILSNIQMKHHIKYENVSMDQECNAILKHHIKIRSSNCPPLALYSCFEPLISDQSHIWPRAECLVTCQSDAASTHRHLAGQVVDRPASDSVIQNTKVCDIKKLQVGCYDEVLHLATKQRDSVRAQCAGALYS